MDFIAYASAADNQVKLPQYIAYGLPNKEAASKVPADLQKDLPTAPDNLSQEICPRCRLLDRQYRGADEALQRLAGEVAGRNEAAENVLVRPARPPPCPGR